MERAPLDLATSRDDDAIGWPYDLRPDGPPGAETGPAPAGGAEPHTSERDTTEPDTGDSLRAEPGLFGPSLSEPDEFGASPTRPGAAEPDQVDSSANRPDVPAGPDKQEALSKQEINMLSFERQWWRQAGAKEQAIRDQFQLSPTRYYQTLNALLDSPAALEYDPALVNRLRRLRASRLRGRARG